MEDSLQSNTSSKEEELRQLLEENLKISRESHAMLKKVRRYMAARAIFSFIYFLLIVGPLIFAIWYLPPLIEPYIEQYQQLLESVSSAQQGLGSITVPAGAGTQLNPSSILDLLNQFQGQ